MIVSATPARVAAILASTLGFGLALPGSAALVGNSIASTEVQLLLAQADDPTPPPSPDAIVRTAPPAPFAEDVPHPLPGYAWDPGHWAWDGGQYVWRPGTYIVQPTNGAAFTPGYRQQYSGGWAWVGGG